MRARSSQLSRWSELWSITWPQILMLLVQFGIGLTDVWAGGRLGADVQALSALSPNATWCS